MYGVATAAALGLCVTLLALVPALRPDTPHERAFVANALERRSIALRHGDLVALNVNSELSVSEYGERTSVRLDRGEAHFSVQPGQSRTFVVEAGEMQVTVTGTAFEVAHFEKNAIVAVERGSVQVRVGQAPMRALRGGDRLLIAADGNVRALSPIPPELVAAWRDGQLMFVEEPLSLVLERLQLYTPNRISLAASVNADLLVSATFANEDFASVLDGLDQTLAISIERSAAGDIQVVAD
jgi:transmembrane sensor